ncbi:MAG TPA: GGDEF domain-containing protein [Lachnospiraceae bacterium]|nr:GGDEF domain-containing protein [Lachnospiraceae bacterium]
MKNIAVLSSGLTVDHATRIIKGIRECINEHEANAFVFTCSRRYVRNIEHDVGEYNIYSLPDFSEFDGVIMVNSTVGSEEILEVMASKIEAVGTPAVGIDREDPNMFNVSIDNKIAMKEIVRHFVEHHGFTRLNYISGPLTNEEAIERFEAYTEVLREHNIPIEKDRIYYDGTFLKDSGMKAMEIFLKSGLELPQAVISANDVMILGAYEVLEKHGLRVPEDIAISGFDDDMDAKYHVPTITSVARRQEEVGYTACEKLVCGMKESDCGKRLAIPTKSKFRESCGCRIRLEADNVAFRKMHYTRKSNDERYLDITKDMSIDLTSVESFEQLKKYMKIYIPRIDCEEMYLFLCDQFADTDDRLNVYQERAEEEDYLREGFGKNNVLLIGYNAGEFVEDVDMDFAGFLQSVKDKGERNKFYIISPIHFRDRCFGYSIIGNSEFPYENQLFYTWLLNIGNAIETIRKQMLMRSMIDKLDSVWSYDTLTGVYNRSGFRKYGSKVWEESRSNKKDLMILFMDLDGLKIVNDNFGHEEGDRLISTFARLLKEKKRHGEAIMRYGGDEFVIIGLGDQAYAEEYIASIERAMVDFNQSSDWEYDIDASLGYYIVGGTACMGMEEAIEIADTRMYENKKRKKAHKMKLN